MANPNSSSFPFESKTTESDVGGSHPPTMGTNSHNNVSSVGGNIVQDDASEIAVVMQEGNQDTASPKVPHQAQATGPPPMGMGMLLGNSTDPHTETPVVRTFSPTMQDNNTWEADDDGMQNEPFVGDEGEGESAAFLGAPRPASPPPFNAEQERTNQIREKEKILFGLYRLRKKGVNASTRYTIDSDLDTMRDEYKFLKRRVDMDASRAFSAKMLVMIVTAFEFMNDRWDPFDLYLDGWSEHIHENISDYDEVFDQLYEKYKDKMAVAPEVKLMLMLGGSAFMFHMTNSMFRPSATASAANLPKETVRNMMAAANREVAPSVPVAHDRPMSAVAPPSTRKDSLDALRRQRDIDVPPTVPTARPVAMNNSTIESLRQYIDTNSDNGSVTSSISIVTKGGTRRRKKLTVARLKL